MYHRIRACWDLGIHSRNVELLCTPKRIFSSTLPVPRPVKTKSSVYVFSGSNKDTVSDVCLIIRLFFVTIMQYQAKDITVIKNMFVAWHENPNNGYTSTQISAVSANMKVSWTYCHISLKNFRSPLILSLHVIPIWLCNLDIGAPWEPYHLLQDFFVFLDTVYSSSWICLRI